MFKVMGSNRGCVGWCTSTSCQYR